MTDLARLALLLTDQKARDEAPCVPVVEGTLTVVRSGNCWLANVALHKADGSHFANYEQWDAVATLDLPALVASAARMREALAPFAKAGELFARYPSPSGIWQLLYEPAAGPDYRLTSDHCLAARAALEEKP
jgi:hypothetical protein